MSKPFSRILVTRTDRIGDLVLSTPVFAALRARYPKAWIAALTFLPNRQILEGNPYLDEVILYDKQGAEAGWLGQWRFARKLARQKFDVVIHLHATNRMHVSSWLAGIPIRIGWARKSDWALTRKLPDLKKEGKKHEAEYNFVLLKLIDVLPPSELRPFFPVPEKAAQSLEMLLRQHEIPENLPLVVLSPGASCPSKRWPAEKFGDLAGRLSAVHDVSVIVIGTEQDQVFARKIQSRSKHKVYDLSGRLSLSMLGALFKRSNLLISNDSGPVHIASAVGTPVVSIFGRNQPGLSPERWRPLGKNSVYLWEDIGCRPCLAHNCQIQFLCLEVINVEAVLKEAENFLAQPAAKKSSAVILL